jgi:hypothetical protein
MTRTFLVAIDLDDDADLTAVSEDIQFLLSDEEYKVSSVRPWSSPNIPTTTLEPFTLPTLQVPQL